MTTPTTIKDRVNNDGMSKIYLRYTYKRRFFLIPINLYTRKSDMNSKGYIKSSDENFELKNKLLKQEILKVEKLVIELQLKGIEPTIDNVKNQLKFNTTFQNPIQYISVENEVIEKQNQPSKDFETNSSFYLEFQNYIDIKYKSKQIDNNTKTRNEYTLKLIKMFSQFENYPITFNTINNQFYTLFISYCYEKHHITDNTIDTFIKNLKTFMKNSFINKLHSNTDYLTFKRITKESKIITLEYNEIVKLFNVKIENNIEELTRDISILMVNTGLRYSDIKLLKKHHFVIRDNDIRNRNTPIFNRGCYISISTQKTNDNIIIPFNDAIKYIYFKYYHNDLDFSKVTNQIFNKRLVNLCRKVDIIEPIEYYFFQGTNKIKVLKPKCEFITSHSLRRTFISQSLRSNTTENVMSISSHKNHQSLERYIKMDMSSKIDVMKSIESSFNTIDI